MRNNKHGDIWHGELSDSAQWPDRYLRGLDRSAPLRARMAWQWRALSPADRALLAALCLAALSVLASVVALAA